MTRADALTSPLGLAGASIRAIAIDPHADARWREFVVRHSEATIYHHPAWIGAIEGEYGRRGIHLACEDAAGRLVGILPLMRTTGLPLGLGGFLVGPRLSSLPRTPLAGPLSESRQVTAVLLREALSRTKQIGDIRLEIKGSGSKLDGLVDGFVSVPWRNTYVLDLPAEGGYRVPDGKERAKIKWAVSKAAKMGISVGVGETEQDLRDWYRIYLETMRRSVVPARPYRFFVSLWHTLRPAGLMDLLVANYGEAKQRKMVAGAIFLTFNQTISYTFSGMDRRYGALRANDLIQWHAINDACQRGFRYFDFGEVPDGHSDLARFKTKWGAQPQRLYRYYSPARTTMAEESHGLGWLTGLSQSLWHRLPLPVTAWISDRIYSYL